MARWCASYHVRSPEKFRVVGIALKFRWDIPGQYPGTVNREGYQGRLTGKAVSRDGIPGWYLVGFAYLRFYAYSIAALRHN